MPADDQKKNEIISNPHQDAGVARTHQAAVEAKKKKDALRAQRKAAATNKAPTQPSKAYYPDTALTKIKAAPYTATAPSDLNTAFKAYGDRLTEYDNAKAIVRAKYSHQDVSRWHSVRHRLFSFQLSRYEKARDEVNKLKEIRSHAPANKFSPSTWLPATKKYISFSAKKLAVAEAELIAAETALVDAETKLLADARANKKAALEGLTNIGADKATIDILTALESSDDEILKLEQEQTAKHVEALDKITDWHLEGSYKNETPSFADLSLTPSYQKIYDLRKGAEKDAEELQKKLTDEKTKLNKQLLEIQQRRATAPAPTDAENKILNKAEEHIKTQVEAADRIIKASKEALKAEDKKANEHLEVKYKNFFSDTTKASLKGGVNKKFVGAAGVTATLFSANYVTGMVLTASLLAPPASFALAAPIVFYLGWVGAKAVARTGMILYSKATHDEFIDDHGHQVIAARIGSTDAYLALVVDEKGKATGVTVGGGIGNVTKEDRILQVNAFIDKFIQAGIIEVPGGILVMTSIPDYDYEVYAEYCNLLTARCQELGIKIKFEDPRSKKNPIQNEAANEQKIYAEKSVAVQQKNQKELAEFTQRPENIGASPEEVANRFEFYKMAKTGTNTESR